MKRKHSESDLLSTVDAGQAETELARTFRRVKKSASLDAGRPTQYSFQL